MLRRLKSSPTNLTAFFKNLSPYSRRTARFNIDSEDDDDDGGNGGIRRQRFKPKHDHGLQLHKSRGQHLLTNPRVLDSIVRNACIQPSDTVLEIGPGTGNLTFRLLQSARRVIAVEIDRRMIEVLNRRVSECQLQDRLTVICEDVVKTQFPEFDICVANIPYGISSPLIIKLLYGGYAFRSATLLLQKEFAHRLMANPGNTEFNRLAANVNLVSTVELLMDVSKRDFVPCPKVDSSLVRICPRSKVPDVNLDEWRAFTQTCFEKRNKTLGAIFKQKKKVSELLKRSKKQCGQGCIADEEHQVQRDYDDGEKEDETGEEGGDEEVSEVTLFKERIVSVLKAGGFDGKRPSKLSVEELLSLLSLLNQAGIHFTSS